MAIGRTYDQLFEFHLVQVAQASLKKNGNLAYQLCIEYLGANHEVDHLIAKIPRDEASKLAFERVRSSHKDNVAKMKAILDEMLQQPRFKDAVARFQARLPMRPLCQAPPPPANAPALPPF